MTKLIESWHIIKFEGTFTAKLTTHPSGEVVVTFSKLPECITGADSLDQALIEAKDALAEAIAGRIHRGG